MSFADGARYDPAAAAGVIAAALALPGGAGLLVGVLARLPGTGYTAGRRSWLRSSPERVEVGEWRFSAADDHRLRAEHVVNGIVLAEQVLPAGSAAERVAGAVEKHLADHGSGVLPDVVAALAGLAAAAE